jgi:hypothetical protein
MTRSPHNDAGRDREEREPLYDSNDDFVMATQWLRVHKALYEEDD